MGIVISDQPHEILDLEIKVSGGPIGDNDVEDMSLEEFMKIMPEGFVADMWCDLVDHQGRSAYVVARGAHAKAWVMPASEKSSFNEEAAKLLALSEWPA